MCERERNRADYAKNKESITRQQRLKYKQLRQNVVTFLGDKCVYCGCDVYDALEINHKDGGGAQESRKTSKWTFYREILDGTRSNDDLELTCRVCNSIHYMKMKGIEGWVISWKDD